jgi:Xaa-Pro aminopeptidase
MRARQRTGLIPPDTIVDPGAALHEMRLVKTPDELAALRKAVELTAAGHLAAMRASRPGLREFQIQAILEERYRTGGAVYGWGYYPIVASGPNSTILHYHENDTELRDGELLLIDSGAEYDFYTADVTRTFPVNGRFTAAQQELYEIVLASADAGIAMTRPGETYELVLASADAGIAMTRPGETIEGIHDACTRILIEGMLRCGLLAGSVDSVLESKSYRRYYMHRTSHWLGMDVHDVGAYHVAGKPRPLDAGMVFTIEPGIYVAPDDEAAPEKYRGIGIRIEDDLVVTTSGHENLTAHIPRTVADLAKARA